ncbi:MAG: hypothetical protein ACLUFV_04785 [Acutalibacteraceae bacterium]
METNFPNNKKALPQSMLPAAPFLFLVNMYPTGIPVGHIAVSKSLLRAFLLSSGSKNNAGGVKFGMDGAVACQGSDESLCSAFVRALMIRQMRISP